MNLYYRPIKIWPEGWRGPGHTRDDAPWSPFRAGWRDTMEVLSRELHHLGADEAVLQVDTAEGNCRIDGGLRGDAKVGYHGVILVLDSSQHGTLTYACNKFDAPKEPWRQNVRAIALGLEALRKVERYGIADRGQQYAGYAELGTGGIALPSKMTVEEAADLLAEEAWPGGSGNDTAAHRIFNEPDWLEQAYRAAARRLHPDVLNPPENAEDRFHRVTEARDLIQQHWASRSLTA